MIVSMKDSAPSHCVHLTKSFLKKFLVKRGKIMEWPACSQNLKPTENLWNYSKTMYILEKSSIGYAKEDLWNAI